MTPRPKWRDWRARQPRRRSVRTARLDTKCVERLRPPPIRFSSSLSSRYSRSDWFAARSAFCWRDADVWAAAVRATVRGRWSNRIRNRQWRLIWAAEFCFYCWACRSRSLFCSRCSGTDRTGATTWQNLSCRTRLAPIGKTGRLLRLRPRASRGPPLSEACSRHWRCR